MTGKCCGAAVEGGSGGAPTLYTDGVGVVQGIWLLNLILIFMPCGHRYIVNSMKV